MALLCSIALPILIPYSLPKKNHKINSYLHHAPTINIHVEHQDISFLEKYKRLNKSTSSLCKNMVVKEKIVLQHML